jgi:hypothetical protein
VSDAGIAALTWRLMKLEKRVRELENAVLAQPASPPPEPWVGQQDEPPPRVTQNENGWDVT